jgi:hypothetical protein
MSRELRLTTYSGDRIDALADRLGQSVRPSGGTASDREARAIRLARRLLDRALEEAEADPGWIGG